jgi:hypothetical protein
VLGHNDVSDDHETVPQPGVLQHAQEEVAPLGTSKLGLTVIAAAGDEVEVLPAVPALQASGHGSRLAGMSIDVCEEGTRWLWLAALTHPKTADEWGIRDDSLTGGPTRHACGGKLQQGHELLRAESVNVGDLREGMVLSSCLEDMNQRRQSSRRDPDVSAFCLYALGCGTL